MRLCVFQGTFNPIHNAHLEMAKFVISNYNFDKILFIPAYRPPHKNYMPELSQHRYNMVQIATQYNVNFAISDIEFKNEGRSYTYVTIQKLYRMYNITGKINFIIGTDAFEQIESWYEADNLKELVRFLVFRRAEYNRDTFEHLKREGYQFEFLPMNFIDISSTQIRENVKNNISISELVPSDVEEYIKEYGLYK